MAPLKLRVLTLNCWDLPMPRPFGSADRKLRIDAIGQELAQGFWDIVALEEVWSQSDYEKIRKTVAAVLPNAMYFHSGYIGSGLCLFTKGRITSSFTHPYTLNGYAHHVHRGDWYGGKAVAMARIMMRDEWSVSVYVTHMHARYSEKRDKYCAHRLVQAYELGQFVRETSGSDSDITLVMGDLNLEPDDDATRLLMESASLRDAYLDAAAAGLADGCGGCTCGLESNSYTALTTVLRPKRFDYIFYKTAANVNAQVERCETTMGRIPTERSLSYSDHEAVCAELSFCKEPGEKSQQTVRGRVSQKLLDDCVAIVDKAIAGAKAYRKLYGFVALICIIAFALTILLEAMVPHVAVPIIRLILILLLAFSFWNGVVMLQIEINSLKSAKGNMQLYPEPLGQQRSENSSSSGSFEYDETTALLHHRVGENGPQIITQTSVSDQSELIV